MRPAEHEVPPSQRDRSLPMIVNLRGDEDFAPDFYIDAEGAMELLGIKRSRLTQISGRELRVGRIRRDRYLRPVYRELDLRDYQEWTRATATHQTSSKAIEQAIDSLDDRFNDLFVVINERLQHFQSQELGWFTQEFRRLRQALGTAQLEREAAREAIENSLGAQQQDLQAMRRELRSLILAAKSQLERSAEQGRWLQAFHQDLREVLGTVTAQRREQLELRQEWARSRQAEAEAFEEHLERRQRELLAAMELTITKVQSSVQETCAELVQAEAERRVEAESALPLNMKAPPRRRALQNPRRLKPYLERD